MLLVLSLAALQRAAVDSSFTGHLDVLRSGPQGSREMPPSAPALPPHFFIGPLPACAAAEWAVVPDENSCPRPFAQRTGPNLSSVMRQVLCWRNDIETS